MKYLIFVISLLMYFFAPNKYDYTFCLIVLIIFLINVGQLLKIQINKNGIGLFSFSLLFSVSFLFVNFIYPVIIYPIDKGYFPVFDRFYFNENLISKTSALALVGFNSFVLGFLLVKRKVINNIKEFKVLNIYNFIYYVCLIFSAILILYVFLSGLSGIIARKTDTYHEFNQTILLIVQCLINITIVLNFLLRKPIFNLLMVFIFAGIFVYIGDRGPAIQTVLVMLFSYSILIRKFTKKQIILLITGGFIILTIASSLRSRDGGSIDLSKVRIENSFDFAMDLIVNNRNLYAGYEYALMNGLSYGKSSIYYIFSPIPFLPSFITQNLFGAMPQELSSSTILTKDVDAGYGLGTNLISDLYMQFALPGVLIFMFLLGLIISKLESRVLSSFNSLLIYITIASFSVYMARSSMFDSVRYIAWSFMIFYIIYYFIYPHVQKKIIISK